MRDRARGIDKWCRDVSEIEMCQMLLASPRTAFMPVHSLMRSKIPWATALCCGVAESVLLIILMGHKRK